MFHIPVFPLIAETGSEIIEEMIGSASISRRRSAPASEVMVPASKYATTFREPRLLASLTAGVVP